MARQDSFLEARLHGKDRRKRPREAWNYVGIDDDDAKVLEMSPLWDMRWLGSSPLQQQQEGLARPHLIVGPSPLGLRLTMSPSFMNLIQMKLAQSTRAKTNHDLLDTESVTKPRPKASQFHASILQIGAWEWKSRYAGDLVAKFYYTNSQLVWEILYEGLKRKIEIEWKYISALKVTSPEGGPGTFEIMLSHRPSFWRETNQEPGKHTNWLRTMDFTGGQASICRKHTLWCAPGLMNKHIEKLLSSDNSLYSLSQKDTMHLENPFFEPCHAVTEVPETSNVQSFHRCNDYHHFGQQQLRESVPMPIGTNTAGRNYTGAQNGLPLLTPSAAPYRASVMTGAASTPRGIGQQRDMFNTNNTSLQAPHRQTHLSTSNGRITMNDTASHTTNPRNPGNLLRSVGTAPGSLIRPEQVRSFINNVRSSSKRPVVSWATPPSACYSNARWPSPKTRREVQPPATTHYAFNNTISFNQSDLVIAPPASNADAALPAMTALEKLSHDLLSDIDDDEPGGAAQDEMIIMSAVSSLASLLQHEPGTAESSQASNNNAQAAAAAAAHIGAGAEATQGQHQVDVAPPASGGGGGGVDDELDLDLLLSPGMEMESVGWEQEEPIGEIEMDMAYLSQLLPFCP